MADLFFKKGEALPNSQEWVASGKPRLYKEFFNEELLDKVLLKVKVVAWDEYAFGGIRIQVGEQFSEGKDEAECQGYLARGSFYTAGQSRIYRQVI